MKPILDLAELLKAQAELQRSMGNPLGFGESAVKENLLHVMVEATEALREINFKPWKTQKKPVNRTLLATELTDILQFWANAALAVELTPEELTSALRAKWQVNYKRIADNEVRSQDPQAGDGISDIFGPSYRSSTFTCDHNWVTDPKSHGLIDTCTKCGDERA